MQQPYKRATSLAVVWPQGSVGSCYWGRSKPERLAFNTQRKLWPPSVVLSLFVCTSNITTCRLCRVERVEKTTFWLLAEIRILSLRVGQNLDINTQRSVVWWCLSGGCAHYLIVTILIVRCVRQRRRRSSFLFIIQ